MTPAGGFTHDDPRIARVRAIADRVSRSYGLELFDVQFRRESAGWVLRIIIDRPGGGTATGAGPGVGDSVGLADCQRVSQDVSAILDVEGVLDDDAFAHPYTLEVSSPGLDRPLRGAGDYRRFVGRLARIVAAEPIEGQTHFRGRIAALDEETVVLEERGRLRRIPLPLVRQARLDVEF